jgi:hypothetical protein
MAYSDSSHFCDQLSYKTLFILSYGLKDINYTRFKQFSAISRKIEKQPDAFLTEKKLTTAAGGWDRTC